MTPLVYIVVLNYNGAMYLDDCLRSIGATCYPKFEVLVVDNASTDGSAARASAHGAGIVRSTRNRGWSGGNNLGIRFAQAAGARYVVLANNDIRVDPRWIAEAVRVAEAVPEIGIVGFEMYERADTGIDAEAAFLRASAAWRDVDVRETAYVGGMAMFVRMEVFDEIGLIDENFFAYGEENDFQLRARAAGYRVAAINVPVWHHGEASFGRQPFRAALLQTENNIQLLIKHASPRTILRAAMRHLGRRCRPGQRRPGDSIVEGRLAPGSGWYNAGLLALATLHLAPKLPAVLRRRAEDRRRVALVRARRANGSLVSRSPTPGDLDDECPRIL